MHTVITPLHDKNKNIIGYTAILEDITYQKRLEYFSTLDPLTSLYNKQYFHNYLKAEYKRAIWKKELFALLLIKVNDDKSIVADFTAGVAYGVNNILAHANIALQKALISQKKYRIYKNKQSLKDEKIQMIQRLKVYKTALYNGNIIPYFQPIINAKNRRIGESCKRVWSGFSARLLLWPAAGSKILWT